MTGDFVRVNVCYHGLNFWRVSLILFLKLKSKLLPYNHQLSASKSSFKIGLAVSDISRKKGKGKNKKKCFFRVSTLCVCKKALF